MSARNLSMKLLEPFSIGTAYAGNNFAYDSKISAGHLVTGKKYAAYWAEPSPLRTRIKRLSRKTICFSKDKGIYIAVIATFINLLFLHW